MQNFNTATLLVVDVQVGIDDLFDSPRNNPQAEENIASLLKAWRAVGGDIVHIKHNSPSAESPLRPELPGNAFKPVLMVNFVSWLKQTKFWLPENPSGNEWSGAAGVCVLLCS